MKNKITYKHHTLKHSLMLFTLLLFTLACQKKSEPGLQSLDAEIKISLTSMEFEDPTITSETEQQSNSTLNAFNNRNRRMAFSKGRTVDVSLTVEEPSKSNNNISKGLKAGAVRKTLAPGILYGLLVYDNNGNYVTEKQYNYGTESTVAAIPLDGGSTYTFIAYSINNTSNLPSIINKQQLSTASIENIGTELMYFKTSKKVVTGINLLNVILKHQFSVVTTTLTLDPNLTGYITKLDQASLNPTYSTASLKLSDNSLKYNNLKTTGTTITFPQITGQGVRTITSSPTFFISPQNNIGTLDFGTITIDDEIKTKFKIPDIKFTPGLRYSLNIKFQTCTQDVSGADGMNWYFEKVTQGTETGIIKDGVFYKRGSTIEMPITAPGADYGFVFDISQIDNAFNMELNGVKLAKEELQFERGASTAQNVRFKDQSYYQGVNTEGGTIPAIFNMIGTQQIPLIKLVISKTGEVKLYGAKKSNGPLYELELFGTNSFNKFKWNTSAQGTNNVKITQIVDERTILIGYGSGKKKIACQ